MENAQQLLQHMIELQASDLYLTVGFPASYRSDKGMHPVGEVLAGEKIDFFINQVLSAEQRNEFERTMEYNAAYSLGDSARFRINVYRQKQEPAMVIRKINTQIPTFEQLQLPVSYRNLALEKRGLVLIVGPTGSGKSSSLAAMIGHRNTHTSGHIITVEDPIEFMHDHKGCIITQRDVGIDTESFGAALKNALRQRPDVVLIGEIRDRDTMEHAINFSETGHLCLATLHANNSPQAIERVLSFFPEEKQRQIYMNLALNIKGILSQRLVANRNNTRSIATEILLNQGLIRELIEQGKIKELRPVMEANSDIGMLTFDQSLLQLYMQGAITEETAVAESDNPANLRLAMKQAAVTPQNTPAGLAMAHEEPSQANGQPTDKNNGSDNTGGGSTRRHFTI